MAWTTTTLLAHIRRVASLPTVSTAAGYTDADLLAHADAALQSALSPLVAASRDEHAIHFVDVSVAAGQQFVRLPPRVASGRLRAITQPSSVDTPGYVTVPRLSPEDVATFASPFPTGPQSIAVVVQAGFLQIVPQPSSAVTLRISYVRKPSTLAAVSTCQLVSAITPGTPNVTFTHSGASLTGPLDVVLASNGDSLGDSVPVAVSGVGSTGLAAANMSARFVNNAGETTRYVAEGVYLCPQETTCIVPLPDAMSAVLAYRAAIAVMHAIGDSEGVSRIEDQLQTMEREAVTLVSERVEAQPQRIRPSLARRSMRWWGG